MGHYYSEMCCQTCGRIPCTCPKQATTKREAKARSTREQELFLRITKALGSRLPVQMKKKGS